LLAFDMIYNVESISGYIVHLPHEWKRKMVGIVLIMIHLWLNIYIFSLSSKSTYVWVHPIDELVCINNYKSQTH